MNARTRDDALENVVPVIPLVPLVRAGRASDVGAIVPSFGTACSRTEGDAAFLVVHNDWTIGRLRLGDILHWVAEPQTVLERQLRLLRVTPGQDWIFSRRPESSLAAAKARP